MKKLCAICARKSGGVWPSTMREEFKWGVCDGCDTCCGVVSVDGWDWPIPDSHKQIASDLTSLVAAVCLISILSYGAVYGT